MTLVAWDQGSVRAFALSLPEAQEHSHLGRPDLRVRNRIFLTLPEDDRSVNLKTTPIALDMLVRTDPYAFKDVWGGRWVRVDLAKVSPDEVRDLVIEAYCLAAPRRLAAQARSTSH